MNVIETKAIFQSSPQKNYNFQCTLVNQCISRNPNHAVKFLKCSQDKSRTMKS